MSSPAGEKHLVVRMTFTITNIEVSLWAIAKEGVPRFLGWGQS